MTQPMSLRSKKGGRSHFRKPVGALTEQGSSLMPKISPRKLSHHDMAMKLKGPTPRTTDMDILTLIKKYPPSQVDQNTNAEKGLKIHKKQFKKKLQ